LDSNDGEACNEEDGEEDGKLSFDSNQGNAFNEEDDEEDGNTQLMTKAQMLLNTVKDGA
jgi:hypothetical protein